MVVDTSKEDEEAWFFTKKHFLKDLLEGLETSCPCGKFIISGVGKFLQLHLIF